MRTTNLTILLLLATAALSACGSKSGQTTTRKETYSYTINGCSTDLQSFSSVEELCKGLQDETRNKGCGLEQRKEQFQKRCQGTFQPTNATTKSSPASSETSLPKMDPAPAPEKKSSCVPSVVNTKTPRPDLSGVVDTKNLPVSEDQDIEMLISPAGSDQVVKAKLKLSCTPTLVKAAERKEVLSILSGGSALVVRNRDAGSQQKQVAEISCGGTVVADALTLPVLNERIQPKKLTAGERLEVKTQGASFSILCAKDEATAAFDDGNGLSLVSGSTALLWTDADAHSLDPVVVVLCE